MRERGASDPRDFSLDGLRGLCALAVLYAHIFLPGPATDPQWAPPMSFMWVELGYPAVLMFFMLSGYVVGLITNEPASPVGVRTYIRNRIARLMPLNTLAVLVSWMLAPNVSGQTVMGNLLFMQNTHPYPLVGSFPLLPNNAALWSLNYEIVYYLGFMAIWCFKPSLTLVFAAMIAVVCSYAAGAPIAPVFAYFACGALYWLCGLAIAWRSPITESRVAQTNWVAAILCFFVMWRVGPVREVLYEFGLFSWLWQTPVSPHRLDQLAVAAWLLLAVTNRAPRLRQLLTWSCLLLPTAALTAGACLGRWTETSFVAAVALLSAWFLAWRTFPTALLARIAPVGGISYAIYVIGSPLQIGQRAVLPEFSGSWLTFSVRAGVLLTMTIILAWFLERRLTPPVAKWIRGACRLKD
jgi:peptidoglycan/LPS O-acetylase OafA/YrhL